MLSRRRWLSECLMLGSLPVLGGRFAGAATSSVKLVIVVQPASPLSELSLRELKRLYTSEQMTDPAGNRLLPLNQPPGSPDRVGFDRTVLQMDPDTVGRFWIDRKIRAQPGAPRSVSPLELLQRAVAAIPGAIAYMREADVDSKLKVLVINGKRPSDADYPLAY